MKKVVAHVKKHHQKLKELDHKILELIHGAELSLILIVSIIGITLGFVMHVSNVAEDRAGQEIEALMETQEGEWLADFTQTENGRKLLLKLIETKDGRAYLENVIEGFDAEHASADEARVDFADRNEARVDFADRNEARVDFADRNEARVDFADRNEARVDFQDRTSIRDTIRSRFGG